MSCPSCDEEMTALDDDEHRVCPACHYEWPARRTPVVPAPAGRQLWLALLDDLDSATAPKAPKVRFTYPRGR